MNKKRVYARTNERMTTPEQSASMRFEILPPNMGMSKQQKFMTGNESSRGKLKGNLELANAKRE